MQDVRKQKGRMEEGQISEGLVRKDGDSSVGKRDLPKANLYGNKIEKV